MAARNGCILLPVTWNDLFGEMDTSYRVNICGRECVVPYDNKLLRIYQYIDLELHIADLSLSLYCWNAQCHNCKSVILDRESGRPKEVLACQTQIYEGLQVVSPPIGLKFTDGGETPPHPPPGPPRGLLP